MLKLQYQQGEVIQRRYEVPPRLLLRWKQLSLVTDMYLHVNVFLIKCFPMILLMLASNKISSSGGRSADVSITARLVSSEIFFFFK